MTTVSVSPPVLELPTPYAIRRRLEDMILGELLGPAGGSEEEVNERHIYERYLVGMLAPLNNSYEAPNPFSKTIFPSSLGLTFCVDAEASAIQVTARWGKYEKVYSETLTTEKGNPKRVWKREQIQERKQIALRKGDLKAWEVNP